MRPIVNGLEGKYSGRVNFRTIDFYAKENQELVKRYRVSYHPTFVVLDGAGNVIRTFFGSTAEAALDATLQTAASGR